MQLALIAAMSQNRVIGKDNKLPWHMPADLKHFRKLTEGHAVIMGRKTFDSIGRALPNRMNIIISRDPHYEALGTITVNSLEEALEKVRAQEKAFVIGGSQIFSLAMPKADVMYLTRVETEIEGDVFFPEILENEWRVAGEELHEADSQNPYPYTYVTYERIRK